MWPTDVCLRNLPTTKPTPKPVCRSGQLRRPHLGQGLGRERSACRRHGRRPRAWTGTSPGLPRSYKDCPPASCPDRTPGPPPRGTRHVRRPPACGRPAGDPPGSPFRMKRRTGHAQRPQHVLALVLRVGHAGHRRQDLPGNRRADVRIAGLGVRRIDEHAGTDGGDRFGQRGCESSR